MSRTTPGNRADGPTPAGPAGRADGPKPANRVGRVHLITDTSRRAANPVLDVVAAALRAGVDTVQVRVEDSATDREAYQLTLRVLELCRPAGVTCLVNDRLHIAVAAGADGGHVGAHDLPVDAAARVLGPGAVLGATAREPVTAGEAVAAGATYLGVGPAFPTGTKDGLPTAFGIAGVAAVAAAVPVPVIGIGGVTPERAAALVAAGAWGVAVVAAVSMAADPYGAALDMVNAVASAAGKTQRETSTSSLEATP